MVKLVCIYPVLLTAFFCSGLTSCGRAAPTPVSDPGASPPTVGAKESQSQEDPHLWLEDVHGSRQMAWVKERNAESASALKEYAQFNRFYRDALAILDSKGRIPALSQKGDMLYNTWRDAEHPRGLYRRTTVASMRRPSPSWEEVLDIDALAAKEGVKWVLQGVNCLPPANRRCLVFLSQGGGDVSTMREFDTKTKQFVAGGFSLPNARSAASWQDADHLLISTDFGPGSMTKASRPRIVKSWTRGTPLAEAETVFEAAFDSLAAFGMVFHQPGGDNIELVIEWTDFWSMKVYQKRGRGAEQTLEQLRVPRDAQLIDAYRKGLLFRMHSDWNTGRAIYPEGSLVYAKMDQLRSDAGTYEMIWRPEHHTTIEWAGVTRDGVLVHVLENVLGRLYLVRPKGSGAWTKELIPLPEQGSLSVAAKSRDRSDFFVSYEDFLTPTRLYYVAGPESRPEVIRRQPESFDGSEFAVTQHFARSADGTQIPYFVVASKELEMTGTNPTYMFSYGGFGNALVPSYSGSYEDLAGVYGKLWLERGGVFVVANIRGGGEFGTKWHRAAIKRNRHKAFEDFEAVAEDLITRKITSPAHLGIHGRSNGGILVASTMLRRPELYGAVICGVPLLDMLRYDKLPPGPTWEAEFGDPDDPGDRAYLATYSPYHKLRPGLQLPPMLIYTSTLDDRTHPGHARKMAEKMRQLGYRIYYHENPEGGHKGSSTNRQLAHRLAMVYSLLWRELRN